jgi:hypothetical protein
MALPFHDNVNLLSTKNDYAAVYGAPRGYGDDREKDIIFEYRVVPAAVIDSHIRRMYELYRGCPDTDHVARVMTIKERLAAGEEAWPVVIRTEKEPFDFGCCQIDEGNHRAVACWLLGSETLPVLIMRYKHERL